MTEVSPLGGGEATEQPKAPCLHRVEDGHLSGLPFICTLDKGHEGEHAEELSAAAIEAPGEFRLWTGRTEDGDVYLTALAPRPDGDIETRGEDAAEVAEKLREIAADALSAAYWLEHGTDDWGGAVTDALGKWLEARR